MKHIIFKALILSSILNQAHAASVKKLEVFPPYVSIGCSDTSIDSSGRVGLQLVKLTSSESADQISLTIDQQLKVCTVSKDGNGVNKLAWTKANPFSGYEVQYYDSKTNSLKLRKEIIDNNNKLNRFELIAYRDDSSFSTKQRITESANDLSSAILVLNKNDLLDQNDLDKLDSGSEVKKTIVIASILSSTSIIDETIFDILDHRFSGRNVSFTFIKEKSNYKVKRITL